MICPFIYTHYSRQMISRSWYIVVLEFMWPDHIIILIRICNLIWDELIKKVLILHCDSTCVKWMRHISWCFRITPADCSQCVISVDLMTAWFNHLLADTCSSMWLCSVWEKNFIDFEQCLFVIHEQIQQIVSILIGKLINLDSILS